MLADWERLNLKYPPMQLSWPQRQACHESIQQTCAAKRWTLLAVNVRTNHAHAVVSGSAEPQTILRTLKAWCTQELRRRELSAPGRPIWATHGSTRYLWKPESVERAMTYVNEMQDQARDA